MSPADGQTRPNNGIWTKSNPRPAKWFNQRNPNSSTINVFKSANDLHRNTSMDVSSIRRDHKLSRRKLKWIHLTCRRSSFLPSTSPSSQPPRSSCLLPPFCYLTWSRGRRCELSRVSHIHHKFQLRRSSSRWYLFYWWSSSVCLHKEYELMCRQRHSGMNKREIKQRRKIKTTERTRQRRNQFASIWPKLSSMPNSRCPWQ